VEDRQAPVAKQEGGGDCDRQPVESPAAAKHAHDADERDERIHAELDRQRPERDVHLLRGIPREDARKGLTDVDQGRGVDRVVDRELAAQELARAEARDHGSHENGHGHGADQRGEDAQDPRLGEVEGVPAPQVALRDEIAGDDEEDRNSLPGKAALERQGALERFGQGILDSRMTEDEGVREEDGQCCQQPQRADVVPVPPGQRISRRGSS